MTASNGNEAKACNAVIRMLERRIGAERRIVHRPDQEERQAAEIDVHVTIGEAEFALEHTILEATERVTENYEAVFVPIRKRLDEAFRGQMLSQVGYFHLTLPVDIAFRNGRKAKQRALDRLLTWLRTSVEALNDESQTNYDLPGPGRGICVAATQLGFRIESLREQTLTTPPTEKSCQCQDPRICLRRWRASPEGRPHPPGSLQIIRSLPDHADEASRRRLLRAFSEKCPKLKKWAERARTVLILESENRVIIDPRWLAAEIAQLVKERNDVPNEVVLVEPGRPNWWVCVLSCDDHNTWSRDLTPGYREEFAEDELTEL